MRWQAGRNIHQARRGCTLLLLLWCRHTLACNLLSVRATRAEHFRRFLSLNYAIEWVTTHLQEIPQRIR